jgi:hypothetical protein
MDTLRQNYKSTQPKENKFRRKLIDSPQKDYHSQKSLSQVIVPPSFYTGAIRRLRGEQKD